MASTKQYLDYILENLPLGVSHRAMMGEYIIYYNNKVIGGIYDDRFLIKPTKAAQALLPDPRYELPYEGAKEMLLIEKTDDKAFLKQLFDAVYPELPAPKKKKQK